jgi:hypothetical protein
MEKIILGEDPWFDQVLQNVSVNKATEKNYWRLEEEVNWESDTTYDDGWKRAGAESFMRVGSTNNDPALVAKSGNSRKTLKRGKILEREGGNIIPTLMLINEDQVNLSGKISGEDYKLYQKYVPESFGEKYSEDTPSSQIKEFAENLAALESAGFRPTDPERLLDEMLCDEKHTYLVDFGSDIGSSGYEDSKIELETFEEFFSREDYSLLLSEYSRKT